MLYGGTALAYSLAKNKKNYTVKRLDRRSGYIDLPFLLIVMTLLVIGIVMMFSASYVWAERHYEDGTYYIRRQLYFGALGLVGMFVLSYIDYHKYMNMIISGGLYIVSLVLLVLVLINGTGPNGIKRWYVIAGVSIQPSEIMKLAIIFLFALMISRRGAEMKKFSKGVLPFLLLLAPVVVLMLKQPHLSGTVLICAIGVVMVFVGGMNGMHFMMAIGSAVAAFVGFLIVKGSYFMERVQVWRDPFSTTFSGTDESWQTCQSLIAIGSGGLFGLGLGNSRQKYFYLPETKNDFVFAIVCEELGFIGAMMVIILFVLFVFRGFYIASKAKDEIGMLLAVGLTAQIGIQAFLNIAVVTNAIPNTGISLPFFSYGGSALLMQLCQMGVLLNISRQANIE